MYNDEYRNIISTDFSEIVVEDMQLKYKNQNYAANYKCTQINYRID